MLDRVFRISLGQIIYEGFFKLRRTAELGKSRLLRLRTVENLIGSFEGGTLPVDRTHKADLLQEALGVQGGVIRSDIRGILSEVVFFPWDFYFLGCWNGSYLAPVGNEKVLLEFGGLGILVGDVSPEAFQIFEVIHRLVFLLVYYERPFALRSLFVDVLLAKLLLLLEQTSLPLQQVFPCLQILSLLFAMLVVQLALVLCLKGSVQVLVV